MEQKNQHVEHKYKITVLGPVPFNSITTWDNKTFERYGGITYPVMVLSKLLGKSARIIPVTHVRKKDEQTIKTLLKGHDGVELQHINSDLDQGDVIRTKIVDEDKLLEKQYCFMNPIIPRDIRELLDSDVFAILPATDYEVALETLEFIKTYTKAMTIFDAHGPTTTMTSLGDRVLKFWVERDLWLPYIDILVMNLEEARCSWFAKEYTMEQLENISDISRTELGEFAEYCLKAGVKAVYVTLGDQGCLVYFYVDGQLQQEKVAAVPVKQVVTTIGCGESFIGGLTFGILETKNYVQAVYYANAVGAQRCEGMTYDVFKSFAETKKMVKDNYQYELT